MNRWIIITGVIADQLVKLIVLLYLPHLVLINRGVSFGLFASSVWLFINLILIGLVMCFIKNQTAKSLIIAGGISNLLDRITRGGVVDFINLKLFNFPSFNLADIYICFGAFLLVLSQIKSYSKS